MLPRNYRDRLVRCGANAGVDGLRYWCVVRDELSCGTPSHAWQYKWVRPFCVDTPPFDVTRRRLRDGSAKRLPEEIRGRLGQPQPLFSQTQPEKYHPSFTLRVKAMVCAPVPVFSVILTKHYHRLCFYQPQLRHHIASSQREPQSEI